MPRGVASYSQSKAYTSANAKKYYNENTEKCKEYAKKYRQDHIEDIRDYQKAYREKKKAEKNKDAIYVSVETHK